MVLRVEFDLYEEAGIPKRSKHFALKNGLELNRSLKSIFELHLRNMVSDYLESEDSVYRGVH